jgi:hypothetical protein
MNRNLFFTFILLSSFSAFSQTRPKIVKESLDVNDNFIQNDSISNSGEIDVKLNGKTKYTDYKIFSFKRDTTYIDTTLTIKKEYKFNFLRKDNFELLPFHNQGQTFNNLAYSFKDVSLLPDIGVRAKQFSYFGIKDVNYYEVPTPTTEILYRTGLQQGQVLETLFTLNFSKRFNLSLSYKGIRSLGTYRRSLVSQGNFRTAFQYRTKENQYSLRGHIVTQDLLTQESGGLTATALNSFVEDDINFQNRGRLDVNLENAENNFENTRFYLEQDYKLFSSKDSISNKDFSNLKIGHIISNETKTYNFIQTSATTFLGNTSTSGAIDDELTNQLINNQFFLEFNSKYVLGTFKAKTDYTNYNYGYDAILNGNSTITTKKLRGNSFSFGADWKAKIKNFQLNAEAMVTPGNGRLSGNHFNAEAIFKKDSLFTLKGSLLLNSKSPNFNFLLHQSSYDTYNWENNFSNINTRNLAFSIDSKWGNASLEATNIDNYTYFDENNLPQQFADQVTYLKVKASKEFTFGKFALDNTLMYQKVGNGSSVFRVPEFVTRNTFYYSDYWFKGKPMQVQIGATFKYFTKYKANAYNPLLSEFTIQNSTEIGYPTFDVFFNAQVRRTRLYFKIENVTSDFTDKNYFSAPNYPYRDFVIRFGLVWNWFI